MNELDEWNAIAKKGAQQRRKALVPVVAAALAWTTLTGTAAVAQDNFITVASTTSTEQSGLFGHILPLFKEKTGIEVRVIAQGTGQALDTGRRGDADVVFVHAKAAEEEFVAEGHGVERKEVMYNDFVIVGPGDDPAGIKGGRDAVAALKKVAETGSTYASRGDDLLCETRHGSQLKDLVADLQSSA